MKAGCYIVGAVAIVFSYAALFILGLGLLGLGGWRLYLARMAHSLT